MTNPTRTHLLSCSRSPLGGFAVLVAVVGSAGISGCAAAPPPMPAAAAPPPMAASRETSPPDAEMLALAKAEEEIDRLFPSAGRAGGAKKAPSQPADDAKVAPSKDADGEAQRRSSGGDSCGAACKALGAMTSSADRLCQLAGENDGRCDDARARVRGATSRVKASCPSCVVAAQAAPLAPANPPPPSGPPPGMPGGSKTIQ